MNEIFNTAIMTNNAGLQEDLWRTKQTGNRQHSRLENTPGKLVRSSKKNGHLSTTKMALQ